MPDQSYNGQSLTTCSLQLIYQQKLRNVHPSSAITTLTCIVLSLIWGLVGEWFKNKTWILLAISLWFQTEFLYIFFVCCCWCCCCCCCCFLLIEGKTEIPYVRWPLEKISYKYIVVKAEQNKTSKMHWEYFMEVIPTRGKHVNRCLDIPQQHQKRGSK